MRSLYDAVKVSPSLVPAVYAADQAYGAVTAVDTLGYNDGMLIVAAGAVDATTGDETQVVKLFECATSGGTYTDTGISVTVTTANTVGVARIAGLGTSRLRYLKATLDVGGTSPSFAGTAVIALGNSYHAPVN
jgi:hypothetical protein